jgi:hypothetical protein
MHCKEAYLMEDINVIATTKQEGLFEMRCPKCKASTIATVILTPKDAKNKEESYEVSEDIPASEEVEITEHSGPRSHKAISPNDILDVKNFLNNFDGNFKKIFKQD